MRKQYNKYKKYLRPKKLTKASVCMICTIVAVSSTTAFGISSSRLFAYESINVESETVVMEKFAVEKPVVELENIENETTSAVETTESHEVKVDSKAVETVYTDNAEDIEVYNTATSYKSDSKSDSIREAAPWKIRCTVYCDNGYTKSGQWTREGIIAGKQEWLGKIAVLYRVNEDGSMGESIGTYEFLDTGFGITQKDGTGSIHNGESVDVWRPSIDACWDWVAEYGDYVYIQIIDGQG